jgi:hypothetical protein
MHTQGRIELKRMRAIEALKSVLTHASGVKLRNIDAEPSNARPDIDIVAQVEIYGRSHTLACKLLPTDAPEQMRDSVTGFYDTAAKIAKGAKPVLIAPRLSTNLQKLCHDSSVGVLDLRGNARLEFGEMFIACQQVSQPKPPKKAPSKLEHASGDSAHAAIA